MPERAIAFHHLDLQPQRDTMKTEVRDVPHAASPGERRPIRGGGVQVHPPVPCGDLHPHVVLGGPDRLVPSRCALRRSPVASAVEGIAEDKELSRRPTEDLLVQGRVGTRPGTSQGRPHQDLGLVPAQRPLGKAHLVARAPEELGQEEGPIRGVSAPGQQGAAGTLEDAGVRLQSDLLPHEAQQGVDIAAEPPLQRADIDDRTIHLMLQPVEGCAVLLQGGH